MKNVTYFVYDFQSRAGAPQLENYIAGIARTLYLHHSVREEDLERMVDTLDEIQSREWRRNRRLKRCTLSIVKNTMFPERRVLSIGANHHLALMMDKGLLTFDTEE